MKNLVQFVNESNLTREEVRKDYDHADGVETLKEKMALGAKYGCDSKKKADIQKAILLKLRDLRQKATSFTDEDWYDFIRLEGHVVSKLPEFLKEENPKFVLWIKEYYFNKYMAKSKKLQMYIGRNPGNNEWGLSYADRDTIKMYNKILEYIASATPKTRTEKDDIFDMLVGKFTDMLKDYKEEYLKRVAAYAEKKYKSIPGEIEKLKEKRKESSDRLSKIDWRKNRYEYNEEHKIYTSINSKIERFSKVLEKYTEKEYVDLCVKNATEEFEDNIKALANKIQDEGLAVDKLVVKSIHDDPKIFYLKITDGSKNLFCRSVLAAEFSNYMTPHYRFIITNRSKDDSNYKD